MTDKMYDTENYKALYMFVTNDEYELPMAVAKSVYELAAMVGLSVNHIRRSIYKSIRTKNGMFVKVTFDDYEDE